jgi:hypothetical protein
VRRFVHFSSVAAYGFDFPDGVDETYPVHVNRDVYTDTKVNSEAVVLAAHAAGVIEVTVIRPGDVWVRCGCGHRRRRAGLQPGAAPARPGRDLAVALPDDVTVLVRVDAELAERIHRRRRDCGSVNLPAAAGICRIQTGRRSAPRNQRLTPAARGVDPRAPWRAGKPTDRQPR